MYLHTFDKLNTPQGQSKENTYRVVYKSQLRTVECKRKGNKTF